MTPIPRLFTMASALLVAHAVFSAAALAQPRSEAELQILAGDILETVLRETECRFVVLWIHLDWVAGRSMVRVRGADEGCEHGLAEANRLGRPRQLAFATLATLGEARDIDAEAPAGIGPPAPAVPRSPRNFDLVHEVVE